MNAYRYEVRTITPNDARELLAKNDMNRPISNSRVQLYADEMRKGRWHNNGEDLLFAVDGTLLNGQHRLRAVILSGCAIIFGIKYGIPKELFATLDNGGGRTAADCLGIAGVANGSLLAAIAKMAMQFEQGAHLRAKCTRADVLAYCDQWPDELQQAVHWGRAISTTDLIGSPFAAPLFLAARTERLVPKIADFAARCGSGVGLRLGDPAFTLREFAAFERRRTRNNVKPGVVFAATARAWCADARGQQLRQIRITNELPNREQTEIVGWEYARRSHPRSADGQELRAT